MGELNGVQALAKNHFDRVAVGGTFDRLHRGHRHLLKKAFEVGEIVIIGLTTDEFLQGYPKEHPVSSYVFRRRQLHAFLGTLGVVRRATIVPLNDAFGPAATDESIDALVVSRETEYTAREINEQRTTLGLKSLTVIVVDMVLADDCLPISTTRVRRRELDQEGHLLRKGGNSNSPRI